MIFHNILVTGNNGYVGSVLTKKLISQNYNVTGIDTNYFKFKTNGSSALPIKQIIKDIREINEQDLKDIDAVIHLAALSSEHAADLNNKVTDEINVQATKNLASLAKKLNVKRFLFASTQNVYDRSSGIVTEESVLAPVTEYSKSKLAAERELINLAGSSFSPIIYRPAAVYGESPAQRLDIVLNNLTAWAYTTSKIRIMSDGLGYRTQIHVEDLAEAFITGLKAPKKIIDKQIFNIGEEKSYQIIELAQKIKAVLPQAKIVFTHEYPKTINYKVSIEKFKRKLFKFYKPRWNIEKGINQLIDAYAKNSLTLDSFLGNEYIRVNHFKKLLSENKIDSSYYWKNKNEMVFPQIKEITASDQQYVFKK